MFETVTWVKPDSTTPIMVQISESGDDIEFIEFETSAMIALDDLIRRGHKVYRVYEILAGMMTIGGVEKQVPPFTVRCELNRRGV